MRWSPVVFLAFFGCAVPRGEGPPLTVNVTWPEGTTFEVIRDIHWMASPAAFNPAHAVTDPVTWKSHAALDCRIAKVEGNTRLVILSLREARVVNKESGREQSVSFHRDDGKGGPWAQPRTAVMWSDGQIGAWLNPPGIMAPLLGGADNGPNLLTGFLPAPPEDSLAIGEGWKGSHTINIGQYDNVELEIETMLKDYHPAGKGTHVIKGGITRNGVSVGEADWRISRDLGRIEGKATFTVLDENGEILLQGSDSTLLIRR